MFALERFLKAQGSRYEGFDTALKEIKGGSKRSHWIWYIFPQMKGLGHSGFSNYYGLSSILEAKAYLENHELEYRLRTAVKAMEEFAGIKTAEKILGGLDAKKFRSSMTLFDIVSPDDIFANALEGFFGGKRCNRTMSLVSEELANYTGSTALERVKGRSFDEKAFFEFDERTNQGYSMMCRTTFLLDCVRKGESMKKMVERYLWDNDLSERRIARIESTLRCYLEFSVDSNRCLRQDSTLFNATMEVVKEIKPDDLFITAEKFDAFISGMLSNPVTKMAVDEFIESY